MQTFLFYDLETTGLNKAFDQALHFAAIRTDSNLNELNRYEFKIKLNKDTIPSPYAFLTHKMRLDDIHLGTSEFEAIKAIHSLLNQPGTISLGYNSLGFDDEFLRFSFYRNLLSPYTHQYANQCSRMDIYPITAMFYLYKNHIIKWPKKDEQITLKLEELNAINQFASGTAHNAMVDVEVTLALAKNLMQEKEMWIYLQNYFNKQHDLERVRQYQTDMVILIDGVFGAKNLYQCPALFLGTHRYYTNQTVWLRLDTTDFSNCLTSELTQYTRSIYKKPGESPFILPANERYTQQITSERLTLANANLTWLKKQSSIITALADHYCEYTHPVYPETDVDASLYTAGFWTAEENAFCRVFHKSSPADKAKLVNNAPSHRISNLALRIVGRHYTNTLNDQQKITFEQYLNRIHANDEQAVPIDHQGKKRLSRLLALQEINTLRQQHSLTAEDTQLLTELENYLSKIEPLKDRIR